MTRRWNIGVLTPFVDGFYYGDLVWGLTQEARLHDVRIVAYVTYIADYKGTRIDYRFHTGWEEMDAWIVFPDAVSPAYIEQLARETGKPIAAVSGAYSPVPDVAVACDNRGGMAQVVRHLIAEGHTRIAFIGDRSNADLNERYEGYREALAEAGLPIDPQLHLTTWSAAEAAGFYLSSLNKPSALAVGADHIALEMMQQLTTQGVRIPDDVAVAGFDDIFGASVGSPGLTTVRQPVIRLGIEVMRQLAAILNGARPAADLIALPTELIVRGSTVAGAADFSINHHTLSSKPISDSLLQEIIEAQHMIGRDVIHLQDLSWLQSTNQHWGCLVLKQDDGRLIVDEAASLRGDGVPERGLLYREQQLPPLDQLPDTASSPEFELCIVQALFDNRIFHGFIMTVGPVNERLVRGYDTRKFPNLLGVIHERKILMRGLQERETRNAELIEKLAIVSDTTSDGIFAVHLAEGDLEWITGIEQLLGIDACDLPATLTDFLTFIHPADAGKLAHAWLQHLGQDAPIAIEVRMRVPAGFVWVYLAGRAVMSADGTPVRLIVSLKDIQARKQAEEALQLSERKYRHFFHNTPVMILSLDESLRIMDANPFWLDKMGYAFEDVRGRLCSSFIASGSVDLWENTMHAIQSIVSRIDDLEIQWLTRHGAVIDGKVSSAAFTDNGTRMIYVTVRDITEQKAAERHIYQLAYEDPLTGLANRRLFYERLEAAIAGAERSGMTVTVMMIDLDHFKEVNDSLGHDVGDSLLQYAADAIRRQVRESGLVARIGGDEFMVMLSGTPDDAAVNRLTVDILRELERPMTIHGHELYITASIGLSRYPDGSTMQELIKMADTAMYKAKQQGRNRAESYTEAMGLHALDRLSLGNKLYRALEQKTNFYLVYQPQIDIASGRMVGVEALIRWEDPDLGLVTPAQFIPYAEENGLIVPLGEWALEEACRQLVRWDAAGIDRLMMSVNISSRQLQHPDFLPAVDRILAASGADPARIVFEITETTALQSLSTAAKVLRELHDRGIETALDDFGTGYSSLSVLNRLPLRILKIDRSFIMGMGEEEQEQTAIVQAIIAMSRSLRLKVLAEGVETAEQLRILEAIGCDAYQGYYMSRPVPPAQLEELYAELQREHHS